MSDVTDEWHTMAEAKGAEYLSAYVTILRCSDCETVAGTEGRTIRWVMESTMVED